MTTKSRRQSTGRSIEASTKTVTPNALHRFSRADLEEFLDSEPMDGWDHQFDHDLEIAGEETWNDPGTRDLSSTEIADIIIDGMRRADAQA